MRALRADAVGTHGTMDEEPRKCLICGETVVGRRGNAILCNPCAAGKTPRTCACGKKFRSRQSRQCPDCRREKKRELGKRQQGAKRELGASENGTKMARDLPLGPGELLLRNPTGDESGSAPHEAILALRLALQMSQAELGQALGAGRKFRYSRSYISKLESGEVTITDAIRRAIARLEGSTAHLRILPVGVYSTSELPAGTVILGRPKVCPVCSGVFVYPWATQIYCSTECRREARRRRAEAAQEKRQCHRVGGEP